MFEATVYTAEVAMRGGFKLSDLPLPADAEPLWREARLLFGVSNGRAMGADLAVDVSGTPIPVQPVEGSECRVRYLAAPLAITGPGAFTYAAAFHLRGTSSIEVAPEAARSSVAIAAPWPTPSFPEGMSPSAYQSGPEGFSANWDVPGTPGVGAPRDLGSALPGCSTEPTAGVALLEAVPTYLMVMRTAKYEVLFLVLAFLTYFLFETISRVPIHLVQYGLLGLSVTLFPLLLVSTAEPLGFGVGYLIATAAVLLQATLFTLSVTRRRALTATFGALLALLFGYLYFVVSLENLALLAGTVALFAILSAIMLATRRVQWARPARP
jgi:inner membrane protein